MQERVYARCPKGMSVSYLFQELTTLTGTLHVKIERDPETHAVMAIYELDVEKLDPA
jgi:hypothetical protein